jgi:hypothetical protein
LLWGVTDVRSNSLAKNWSKVFQLDQLTRFKL